MASTAHKNAMNVHCALTLGCEESTPHGENEGFGGLSPEIAGGEHCSDPGLRRTPARHGSCFRVWPRRFRKVPSAFRTQPAWRGCPLLWAVVATGPIEDHGQTTVGQRTNRFGTPIAVLLPIGHHNAEFNGFILDRMLLPIHRTTIEDRPPGHCTTETLRHASRISEVGVDDNGNPAHTLRLTALLPPDLLSTEA